MVGKLFDRVYLTDNVGFVEVGCVNFVRYILNIKFYGVNVVVVVNMFFIDLEVELNVVRKVVLDVGVFDVVICIYYVYGGKGAVSIIFFYF